MGVAKARGGRGGGCCQMLGIVRGAIRCQMMFLDAYLIVFSVDGIVRKVDVIGIIRYAVCKRGFAWYVLSNKSTGKKYLLACVLSVVGKAVTSEGNAAPELIML